MMNTQDLVTKIAEMVRRRVAEGEGGVVSLDHYKELTQKPTPKTLLVIEDDESIRRAICRIFEAENYRVLTAKDASEMGTVLNGVGIDLIILDIGLPWINGLELAEIMKSHADLKNVPLIFVSGHHDVDTMKRGFDVGAADYITKPFDVGQVKKTVDTLLELHGVEL